MRVLPAAMLSILAVTGCGDAVAKPKSSSLAGIHPVARAPIPPVEVVPVTRTRAGGIGALERPSALRHVFEELADLEAGRAEGDVRMVQFGDSHTAADIGTAAVRRSLQARFGDGGRGFVAIGRPWKRYLQEGVHVGMTMEWSTGTKTKASHAAGDGIQGLAGMSLSSRQHGARAWTDIATKTNRAEVAYLEQPGGGAFDVFVDGVRMVRVATNGDRPTSSFRTFDITDASAHQLEVRTVGDGEVRVFGVALDRTEHGVVYDALGINGARITTALSWNETHWAEQLRHRAPALVVLAYGTNESTDDAPAATYERQLVDELGRIARAVPNASCLLLGPPDRAIDTRDGWATAPKILEIIASQRRVAEAAGCAFYDQLDAMGGAGAIAAWAAEDPPRAQKDRVHLSREGYVQLGSSFASDFMRAYAAWRRDSGLPPSRTETSEPVAELPSVRAP